MPQSATHRSVALTQVCVCAKGDASVAFYSCHKLM
jgi:hypothetical protein